jgi:hypothetical protein
MRAEASRPRFRSPTSPQARRVARSQTVCHRVLNFKPGDLQVSLAGRTIPEFTHPWTPGSPQFPPSRMQIASAELAQGWRTLGTLPRRTMSLQARPDWSWRRVRFPLALPCFHGVTGIRQPLPTTRNAPAKTPQQNRLARVRRDPGPVRAHARRAAPPIGGWWVGPTLPSNAGYRQVVWTSSNTGNFRQPTSNQGRSGLPARGVPVICVTSCGSTKSGHVRFGYDRPCATDRRKPFAFLSGSAARKSSSRGKWVLTEYRQSSP